MIVYSASKSEFQDDIVDDIIVDRILEEMNRKLRRGVSIAEINSWKSSLKHMYLVVDDDEIPGDVGISIEYTIPQTGKRVDFIITGQDQNKNNTAVLVELKQWEKAELTSMDGVVSTFVGKGIREVSHPSYQVWSYAQLMRDFNQNVTEQNIRLKPCAYLHNYIEDEVIGNSFYKEYVDQAPVFYRGQAKSLRNFIREDISFGDNDDILEQIDQSVIKPTKSLADKLESLLAGNTEFVMIDDQKVAYENVLRLVNLGPSKKQVVIIEGGPGTGKTVVAINLLVESIGRSMNSRYVTKNAAPRAVYEAKLAGSMKKSTISTLFMGSGSFTETSQNEFDLLLVDEAHRLTAKSGMMSNLGENQVKELINSSNTAVFFLDENQNVHFKDIGTREEIIKWANESGAEVTELELESQFRCNGSDGYLAWCDNTLQIRKTANETLENVNFDFRVFNDPNLLRDEIEKRNEINNKARIVAGYCWDWITKKDPNQLGDIQIPEHDFYMKWNLASDGMLWMIKPESVNEAGCIHTSQGLELDYVGVIIGPDLIIRDGVVVTNPEARSKNDSTTKGYKKLLKEDPIAAEQKMDLIIKNTYRTLMTRATKGCYLYCTDDETLGYFSSFILPQHARA